MTVTWRRERALASAAYSISLWWSRSSRNRWHIDTVSRSPMDYETQQRFLHCYSFFRVLFCAAKCAVLCCLHCYARVFSLCQPSSDFHLQMQQDYILSVRRKWNGSSLCGCKNLHKNAPFNFNSIHRWPPPSVSVFWDDDMHECISD